MSHALQGMCSKLAAFLLTSRVSVIISTDSLSLAQQLYNMSLQTCLSLLLAVNVWSVSAQSTANRLKGEPEIECNADHMFIGIATELPFLGSLYAKGHYKVESCRTSENITGNLVTLKIPYESCGVRQVRTDTPQGIRFEVTIVVSFHRNFLTKLDHSFNAHCFFMEAMKTVGSDFDVDMLQTSGAFSYNAPMPVCRYEVLDGPEGKPVEFAKVGDTVYHRWSCDSDIADMFCMNVHTCFVDSGIADEHVQLIDSEGCTTDELLMRTIEYPADLTGLRQSTVFKYADEPSLFFNCKIAIRVKREGICERPSDACPARDSVPTKRVKRVAVAPIVAEVEVFSEDMVVFTDFDEKPSHGLSAAKLINELSPLDDAVCMSNFSFTILLSISCVFFLLFVTVGFLYLMRSRTGAKQLLAEKC